MPRTNSTSWIVDDLEDLWLHFWFPIDPLHSGLKNSVWMNLLSRVWQYRKGEGCEATLGKLSQSIIKEVSYKLLLKFKFWQSCSKCYLTRWISPDWDFHSHTLNSSFKARTSMTQCNYNWKNFDTKFCQKKISCKTVHPTNEND